MTFAFSLVFFYSYDDHPHLHSFPTRRSSDLISSVITTQFGYHIIKLSEKIPARKVELAKVSDDLKDFLKRQELEKQVPRSEEHTSELQSPYDLVCRLLLEKKKKKNKKKIK